MIFILYDFELQKVMKFVLLLAVFAIGALAICPAGTDDSRPEAVHYPSLSDDEKMLLVIHNAVDVLSAKQAKEAKDIDVKFRWFQRTAQLFIDDVSMHERIRATKDDAIKAAFEKWLDALQDIIQYPIGNQAIS
jgi:hypothetical protein